MPGAKIAAVLKTPRGEAMFSTQMKRSETPRSHRDRHPGLVDHLDNPHPVEHKAVRDRRIQRTASKGGVREAAPR
jgi:hypothetical protein